MDTKILISLMMIGIAGFGIAMGTMAYFSDTETSTGNTMAAGTLDLKLNGYDDPITAPLFRIEDLKPSIVKYTPDIALDIYNNPGRLYKHIVKVTCDTGIVSEPECTDQGGRWTPNGCVWPTDVPSPDNNNLPPVTWFDLAKNV